MQDDNPAASAARELKAAAREALRMGSLWTHHAIQWVDERRNEMNNRNREQEQRERERAERNRYSTSGYGSDEGDYGPGQYGRQSEQSGLSGGRRVSQPHARDRDVQGDYSSGGWQQGRGSQPGYGREGSERFAAQGMGQSRYDIQGSRYGSQGYGAQGHGTGSEGSNRDFSNDYSQGSAHYSAQGSRSSSDYERQSGYGGARFGAHGGLSQEGRDYSANPGGWRASDATGSGSDQGRYAQSQAGRSGLSGGMSSGTGYRGRGPKNYTRSDERIREDLNERLTDSDEIDASNITVEVSSGVATLKGSVGERWMKHRAEDLAESCTGVRDVDNQIRVQSQAASQASSRSATSGSTAPGGSNPVSGSSLGTSGAATASPSASSGSSAPGSSTAGKASGSSTT